MQPIKIFEQHGLGQRSTYAELFTAMSPQERKTAEARLIARFPIAKRDFDQAITMTQLQIARLVGFAEAQYVDYIREIRHAEQRDRHAAIVEEMSQFTNRPVLESVSQPLTISELRKILVSFRATGIEALKHGTHILQTHTAVVDSELDFGRAWGMNRSLEVLREIHGDINLDRPIEEEIDKLDNETIARMHEPSGETVYGIVDEIGDPKAIVHTGACDRSRLGNVDDAIATAIEIRPREYRHTAPERWMTSATWREQAFDRDVKPQLWLSTITPGKLNQWLKYRGLTLTGDGRYVELAE